MRRKNIFLVLLGTALLATAGFLSFNIMMRYSATGLMPIRSSGPPASVGNSNPGLVQPELPRELGEMEREWDARIAMREGIPITGGRLDRAQVFDAVSLDFNGLRIGDQIDPDFVETVRIVASGLPFYRSGVEMAGGLAGDAPLVVRTSLKDTTPENFILKETLASPVQEWEKLLSLESQVNFQLWKRSHADEHGPHWRGLARQLQEHDEFIAAEIRFQVVTRDGYRRYMNHYLIQYPSKADAMLSCLMPARTIQGSLEDHEVPHYFYSGHGPLVQPPANEP